MSQVKNTYESKVNELTKWVEISWDQLIKMIVSEKESMMEYVYQYDNLQRQLQLLQWVRSWRRLRPISKGFWGFCENS